MSDIHGRYGDFCPSDLPAADLCIVAGDITNYGTRYPSHGEIPAAADWLRSLSEKYPLVWIPGNHDIGVDGRTWRSGECILGRVVEIGGLRIAGVSMTICYDMPALASTWDYMTANEEEEKRTLYDDLVAHGPLDILVSHGPPHGFLDSTGWVLGEGYRRIGSKALLRYIVECSPRLVVCGHVHESRGYEELGDTTIINTAERWQVIEFHG